ncbi:glucose-6-phosphate isomerase [Glycocaulis profundi]|nr:glucose-6-phosphate isomerase [Glycocaulis profundi]
MIDRAALAHHAARLKDADLGSLVRADGWRDGALVLEAAGVTLDARRQRLDQEAWDALLEACDAAGLAGLRADLFAGRVVNGTENRPAIHAALRDPARIEDAGLKAAITDAKAATAAFARRCATEEALDGFTVERVVNIGIGGSDLGPRFVWDALKAFRRPGVEIRFVSNLDPADLEDALEGADPETTLVCVTSKSFTTQETLMNALAARAWLTERLGEEKANLRFAAATAAPAKARDFGISEDRVFAFEEGVGGRYSVWSAAGLCLEIALGPDVFARFRDGAKAMDDHFHDAPWAENLPVAKALIDVWNRGFLGKLARCVAAYSSRLEKLPFYLQQLEMESLGKSVSTDAKPLPPGWGGQLVWGGRGSDVQHSFFQWLHQAKDDVPVDFIGISSMAQSGDERATALMANLAAQGAALLDGREGEGALGAHRTMPGGRMSSAVLIEELTPESLGALIALHEHKVFVEGALYGLNPFDQWGVELGKVLAGAILSGDVADLDPSTRDLLVRLGLQR